MAAVGSNSIPRTNDIVGSIYYVIQSHILRSIVWMFCRTVVEPPHNDVSGEVEKATFLKEFTASQTVFGNSTYIDHSAFYLPINMWNPHWRSLGQRVLTAFENKLRRQSQKIIFPQVQRKKNVSESTASILRCYSAIDYVRTVDLECHYHRTGMQIQGECEMRTAWKFNDLKPRLYYCQGGRDYWAARFVKPLAVALMESIPSTNTALRRNPNQIQLDPQDYIVAWDFEAFTTSLSQLKFFISAVVEGLRHRELPNLQVFDYHKGILEIDPCDLLDEYNEICNINAPFSIHRLVDRYHLEDLGIERTDFVQQNSGMLGVAGNIGFSTACHGMEICKVCGEDKCVCVGDDALAATAIPPEYQIIPMMEELGRIHPDKFDRLVPEEDGPIKFVKRALYRDIDSLYLDFLISLPISAYIDNQYGSRTTPPDLTSYKCAKMVAVATGQVLWDVREHHLDLDDRDILYLNTFLRTTYRYMNFPIEGRLPGALLQIGDQKVQIKFTIPSLQFDRYDPRNSDWLEYLLDHTSQMFFSIPVLVEFRTSTVPDPNDEVYVPMQKGWKVLEDCGYVSVESLYEVVMVLNEGNKRRLRWALKVDRSDNRLQLCRVVCLKEIPLMFHDLPMFSDAFLLRGGVPVNTI